MHALTRVVGVRESGRGTTPESNPQPQNKRPTNDLAHEQIANQGSAVAWKVAPTQAKSAATNVVLTSGAVLDYNAVLGGKFEQLHVQ